MKKNLKKIIFTTLFIALVLLETKVCATTGKIIVDTVRVRKEASTESDVVTLVSIEDEVEILEIEEEWYKVKGSDYVGYIRKDMIDVPKETSENQNEEKTNVEEKQEQNEKTTQSENKENTIKKDEYYVINSKVNLKIIPFINSTNISSIEAGNTVQVKDTINKWCYVECGTQAGWTLKSKISNSTTEVTTNSEKNEQEDEQNEAEKEQEESNQSEVEEEQKEKKEEQQPVTKYVSASNLNLRKEPNNTATVIDQISINEKVTVTENVDGTWSKIEYKGKTGYVATRFLSDSKTAVSSRSENTVRENTNNNNNNDSEKNTENESKEENISEKQSNSSSGVSGADIVAYAKQFLGCSYVYGGMSPSGFDCSGFTSYVYKHFGYSLNRTSSGQRSDGVGVEKSNLQAGDIVCFSGHVGIYIGGNSFIHAANPSKGVIITSLSDSYYVKNYITARRIL